MISTIKRTGTGKIIVKRLTRENLLLYAVLILLAGLTIWGFLSMNTNGVDLLKATKQTINDFGNMFGRPKAAHFTFGKAAYQVGITLALAFLTTLLGGIIALFLGLLAAKNLTNKKVSNIIKGFVAFIRAIPTVLWVLIFAIGAGLGAVAAVIGMSFHTVGYLLKAYSESFEELDEEVIEALRANGANWLQIVFQTVIPSSATYLLSWTFMRFEINFAVAVAMGAAAGAGGIGYQLFMSSAYFFDIREIGYITYFLLAVALAMEVVAIRLKSKFHLHE
jgi:phosphonate transport system permease protein